MAEDRNARQRILDAAIAIIDREGESAIRIERVVRDAGFTVPVLYSYFGGRDDLIVHAQAERYRWAMEWGASDLIATAVAAGSRSELAAELRRWMASLNGPEGAWRRQLRFEVLGSAVSRPALREAVQQANRDFILRFAGAIAIVRDRWDLSLASEPLVLASWFVGMILGRHLVESDPSFCDPGEWDVLAESNAVGLLGLSDD